MKPIVSVGRWERIRRSSGRITRLIRGGDAPRSPRPARIVTLRRGPNVLGKKSGGRRQIAGFLARSIGLSRSNGMLMPRPVAAAGAYSVHRWLMFLRIG